MGRQEGIIGLKEDMETELRIERFRKNKGLIGDSLKSN